VIFKLFIWLLGLLFSVAVGHFVVKWLNFTLRKHIGAELKPVKLTSTIGCIERAIYTILTGLQQYHYIAVFFSIKIAQRFITYTKITNDEELKKAGRHANVFIICNIVSLCLGLLGGALILCLISKQVAVEQLLRTFVKGLSET